MTVLFLCYNEVIVSGHDLTLLCFICSADMGCNLDGNTCTSDLPLCWFWLCGAEQCSNTWFLRVTVCICKVRKRPLFYQSRLVAHKSVMFIKSAECKIKENPSETNLAALSYDYVDTFVSLSVCLLPSTKHPLKNPYWHIAPF